MSQRANLVGASHGVVNGGVGVGEESLGNANVGGAAVLKVGSAEEEAGSVRWRSVEVDTCIPTMSSESSLCEANATSSHYNADVRMTVRVPSA
jgi:hypothetical protein